MSEVEELHKKLAEAEREISFLNGMYRKRVEELEKVNDELSSKCAENVRELETLGEIVKSMMPNQEKIGPILKVVK